MAFPTVQIYHGRLNAKVPSNSMWLNKTNCDNLEKAIDSFIQLKQATDNWFTCGYSYKNWKEFEFLGFTVVCRVDSASSISEQLHCANHYERLEWRCLFQRYKMAYDDIEPGLYISITANCGITDTKRIKINSLNEFVDIMLNEEAVLLKYLADNYKTKYNRASEGSIEYMSLADDIKTIITDAGFGVKYDDTDIAAELFEGDAELTFDLVPNGFEWDNDEAFTVMIFQEPHQDGTILRFDGGYRSISKTMVRIMTARPKVPGDWGYSARSGAVISDSGVNVKTVAELMKIIKVYVNTVATIVRNAMEVKYPLNIPNEDDD